jgi:hypothetical protein
LFLAAALALLVAFVVDERGSPDLEQHARFIALLNDAHELDQDVGTHALESRFGFESNYDQLEATDRALRRVEKALVQELRAFLDTGERRQIRDATTRYQHVSTERAAVLEQFESDNALLRSSVGYFPSAVAAALGRSNDPELIDEINEFRGLTLSMALDADAGILEARGQQPERAA